MDKAKRKKIHNLICNTSFKDFYEKSFSSVRGSHFDIDVGLARDESASKVMTNILRH